MSEELKSCPFCDGEAELIHGVPGCWFVQLWYIQCKNCKISTKDRYKENVIEDWNKRI